MEDIIIKLQKLQAMAEGGTTHEAANAKRIYDALILKYGIDEEQLSKKEKREYKCKYHLRVYAVHAAAFLGVQVFTYKAMKNSPLLLDSTEQEYNIFMDIMKFIEAVFKAQQKEAKKRVKSYMCGFVMATYPTKDTPAECPTCKAEMKYSKQDGRYYCPACGFIGKKLKRWELYGSDVMAGKMDSGRLVTQQT